MLFYQIITVIGAIVGIVGTLLGIIGFWYAVRKDRKVDHQFRKEKVEALFNDLLKFMMCARVARTSQESARKLVSN